MEDRTTCPYLKLENLKDHTQSPPNRRKGASRPRPGRRRFHVPSCNLSFLLVAIILAFCGPITAFDRQRFEVRRPIPEGLENGIIFDSRPAPNVDLVKRQFNIGGESSSKGEKETSSPPSEIAAPTSTTEETSKPTGDESTSSGSAEETTGSGGIISAPTPTNSQTPKPFDGGLGTNYTSACLSFMKEMVGNEDFIRCVPVSVLLQVC